MKKNNSSDQVEFKEVETSDYILDKHIFPAIEDIKLHTQLDHRVRHKKQNIFTEKIINFVKVKGRFNIRITKILTISLGCFIDKKISEIKIYDESNKRMAIEVREILKKHELEVPNEIMIIK